MLCTMSVSLFPHPLKMHRNHNQLSPYPSLQIPLSDDGETKNFHNGKKNLQSFNNKVMMHNWRRFIHLGGKLHFGDLLPPFSESQERTQQKLGLVAEEMNTNSVREVQSCVKFQIYWFLVLGHWYIEIEDSGVLKGYFRKTDFVLF